MGVRSVLLCSLVFVAALLAVLALLSLTGVDARAQMSGTDAGVRTQGQSFKLAQSFYYPNYPQVRRKKRRRQHRIVKKCASPWIYSRGLQRCICARQGYGISEGQCVKIAEICTKNALWSDTEQKCQCQPGFNLIGSKCVDPNADVVTYGPAEGSQCLWPRVKSEDGNNCRCAHGYREEAGQCIRDDTPAQAPRRRAGASELLTNDITTMQQCLKEAGYLRASVQKSMGRKAWTAFWFFKQDYSVGRTPKGVYDAKAQHKLFTLCPKVSSQLAALPASDGLPRHGSASGAPLPAGATSATSLSGRLTPPEHKQARLSPPVASEVKPAPEVKAPVRRVYARPEAGCLPGDLHRLIVGAYGKRSALKKCTQTCIAMPANITKREAEEYESKRGIRWCRSCIEIGSQLPLDDILRIERGANVQVCTRPPSRLPKWKQQSTSKRPAYTKVRALYRPFPKGAGHEQAIAVVIGNGSYAKGLPVNASSYANAGALYSLLTEHLGFAQENVIDLRDATLKDMIRVFGTGEDHKGDLWRLVQDRKKARVVIYYAGHAGTREDRSDSYLLPVDAVKYREERSGYPMSRLYANLEKLGAKSVLLLLEAGFSRDMSDFLFPPNLPEMQVSAMPKKPLPGLTVLTAADGDQKTLDDPKFGFGLFTRYLIEGMAGRADLAPIGNGDRKIDAVELYAYTSHMVRLAARKSFGLLQKPMFSQAGKLRVSRVQAQGQ
jgi:hypothetical protein